MSWNGTRNVATLRGILEERGVMRASVRPLKKQRGLPGWFHSCEFSQALQYSSPTLIDRIRCCILLKFDVRCCNSGSSGKVTKGGCLRYGLRGIALVPTCVVPQSIQCCAIVEWQPSFAMTPRTFVPLSLCVLFCGALFCKGLWAWGPLCYIIVLLVDVDVRASILSFSEKTQSIFNNIYIVSYYTWFCGRRIPRFRGM